MDALEYLKTREKMCDAVDGVCDDCSLVDCNFIEGYYPEEAIEIVKRWKGKNANTFLNKLRIALPDADDFVIYEIMQRYCVGQVFGYPQKASECDRNCRACWDDEVLES